MVQALPADELLDQDLDTACQVILLEICVELREVLAFEDLEALSLLPDRFTLLLIERGGIVDL